MSRINLKLKFRKGNYLPRCYDVGRPQDENLKKSFQEHLNPKLGTLKFDNVEDGWNSEKAICLIERRKGLYENYLSDRSYENKNVKKVEKAFSVQFSSLYL